jgi:hypothetical protein
MTWILTTLVVLGVLALGGWLTVRRIGNRISAQFEQISSTAATTPYCARLEPMEEPEWEDEGAVRAIAAALKPEGFRRVGDFTTRPEGRCLRVLCDPGRSAYALIQEQYGQGLSLELLAPYADGRFVTFTNARTGWPQPPAHAVTRCPGADAKGLLARFLRERPAEGLRPTPPEQFRDTYLRMRREAMGWMIERGGPTAEEIRQNLAGFPIRAVAEMTEEITRNQWQAAMTDALGDQLIGRFVAQAGPTAAAWQPVGDRLVAVHDRLGAPQLWNILEETKDLLRADQEGDWDDEGDEEDLLEGKELKRVLRLLDGSTPRQLFPRLNAELTPEQRLTKLGELTQPLPADVYLRPAHG